MKTLPLYSCFSSIFISRGIESRNRQNPNGPIHWIFSFYSNDKLFLRFLHANKSTNLFGGVKSMIADKNEDEIDKTFPMSCSEFVYIGGFQSQGSHTDLKSKD